MKKLLVAGATTAFTAGALLFMLAPQRNAAARLAPYVPRKYYAHRGLYEADQSIPENSLVALDRACQEGYGIELDARLTKDGQVVVFHDDSLLRVCGVEGKVENFNYKKLKTMPLFGTDQHIPLLRDALDLIGGRAPIILELKNSFPRNEELCKKVLGILHEYEDDYPDLVRGTVPQETDSTALKGEIVRPGAYVIQSFDPRILAWFRRHAPELGRGQLAQRGEHYEKFYGPVLGHTLLNFISRPDFIAYKIEDKPFAVRLAEKMGAVPASWTATEGGNEGDGHIVVFEHYRP